MFISVLIILSVLIKVQFSGCVAEWLTSQTSNLRIAIHMLGPYFMIFGAEIRPHSPSKKVYIFPLSILKKNYLKKQNKQAKLSFLTKTE